MKYKVQFFVGSIYEVIAYPEGSDKPESVFQGSLSDCEAYIRLHEAGYM